MRGSLLLLLVMARVASAQVIVAKPVSAPDYPHVGSGSATVVIDYVFRLDRGQYVKLMSEVAADFQGDVLVRYRPLSSSRGRDHAVEAFHEAYAQGKLKKFLESMARMRSRRAKKDIAMRAAQLAGMSLAKLKRSWTQGTHSKRVARDVKFAMAKNFKGRPALYFNSGRRLEDHSFNKRGVVSFIKKDQSSSDFSGDRHLSKLSKYNLVVIKKGRVDDQPERKTTEPVEGIQLTQYKNDKPLLLNHGRWPVTLLCNLRKRQCLNQLSDLLSASNDLDIALSISPTAEGKDEDVVKKMFCAQKTGNLKSYVYQLVRRRYRLRRGRLSRPTQNVTECEETSDTLQAAKQLRKLAKQHKIVVSPSIVVGSRLLQGTKGNAELRTLLREEYGPGLLGQR